MQDDAIEFFEKKIVEFENEGAAWARGGDAKKAVEFFKASNFCKVAVRAMEEAPEVFVIDMLIQMKVNPNFGKETVETDVTRPMDFPTFLASRSDVVRAGVQALKDKTHQSYVDWRDLAGM